MLSYWAHFQSIMKRIHLRRYHHSHTKRNSSYKRVVFIEFSEYVKNSGAVVYWGEISFKMSLKSFWLVMSLKDDGIDILDNNILIAITTTERFRDWVCSYSVWKTGKSFRRFFQPKLQKKDIKHRSSCPKVFCKVNVLKNFVRVSESLS